MADSTINLGAKVQPQYKRWGLPAWLVFICVVTFTVLLSAGAVIYKNAPPIPDKIVSSQQEIILTHDQIEHGQITYLGRGGQHIGSIWGHGSYLAPDWTADVLHRWGLATAGVLYNNDRTFSQEDLEALSDVERATLQARVQQEFKINRYAEDVDTLTLSPAQTKGLEQVLPQLRSHIYVVN